MIPSNPHFLDCDSKSAFGFVWWVGVDPQSPGQRLKITLYTDDTVSRWVVFGREIPAFRGRS